MARRLAEARKAEKKKRLKEGGGVGGGGGGGAGKQGGGKDVEKYFAGPLKLFGVPFLRSTLCGGGSRQGNDF